MQGFECQKNQVKKRSLNPILGRFFQFWENLTKVSGKAGGGQRLTDSGNALFLRFLE